MRPLHPAVVSLSRRLDRVGVTPCTAWRLRKKGWVQTVNIPGRQYLTQEAIHEFHRPASHGELPKPSKISSRNEVGVGAWSFLK